MIRTVLFLCMGIWVTAASAQTLSLDDALSIALKNNIGVRIARNEVDIATINNSYGVAGGLPLVLPRAGTLIASAASTHSTAIAAILPRRVR